ncbi:hypothetical protein [Phyllobacterium endophyticum]|uniref:Uncharacterized protein n=1 Tax=Phyllobacterium endophyticum TaxID=1149773 RepID=A0A2P7AYF8_9HYPH|nr:hypothetical protein [Phyllobacterium endophyticum]MBB3236219.1 hypothetical protein [Phyllobacterium endophyticum]PSH59242.1 hypothetical protein CU100_00040 [Phyllobacterium endophyticum]TYR41366.1 hypothetical protein FY050_08695 [Phyllobacterium endophyticum]
MVQALLAPGFTAYRSRASALQEASFDRGGTEQRKARRDETFRPLSPGGEQNLIAGLKTANDKLVPGTTLNGAFFKEIYAIDPVAEMSRYNGPLFVAVGTKVALVGPQPQMGKLFIKYHRGAHPELMIRDMDHHFNVDKKVEDLDEMIDKTLGYLKKYLDVDEVDL